MIIAQNEAQEFTIPLSNPGAKGMLKVDLHHGRVSVEGHSGNEIMVTMIPHKMKEESVSATKNGLKRIPNVSTDFEIVEQNNTVYITNGHKGEADFKVKIPKQFSLAIATHHDGDVYVKNVNGEMEIDAHHGGIKLEDVSGSVVADTHHGSIIVSLTSVKTGTPMAFTTYHGDVNITLPSNINALAKMRSEKGEIYSDFEMELSTPAAKAKTIPGKGSKIIVDSWIYGTLGSGGPEFMFNTRHGDIILKKGK